MESHYKIDLEVKKSFFSAVSALNKKVHEVVLSEWGKVDVMSSSFPSLDNNVWISLPQIEAMLSRQILMLANPGTRVLKMEKENWKRHPFLVWLEILPYILSPEFMVQTHFEDSSKSDQARNLFLTYSDVESPRNTLPEQSKYWGSIFANRTEGSATLVGLGRFRISSTRKKFLIKNVRAKNYALSQFIQTLPRRVRLWRKLKKATRGDETFRLLRRDFHRSIFGVPALQALAFSREAVSILENYEPELLITPYENQIWERVLAYECKRRDVTFFGYMHSTPRFWDLRYLNIEPFAQFQPEKIIENGPGARKQLNQAGIENLRIISGPAIRFSHLQNTTADGMVQPVTGNTLRALVITGGKRDMTKKMIKLARGLQSEKSHEIHYRPHPTDLRWFGVKFPDLSLDQSTFDQLRERYDYFLVDPMSSLGLELASVGKRVCVYLPDGELNQSPLYYVRDFQTYFHDLETLSIQLEKPFRKVNASDLLYLYENPEFWSKLHRTMGDE